MEASQVISFLFLFLVDAISLLFKQVIYVNILPKMENEMEALPSQYIG
jgi:hypothetical protein